MGEHSSIGSDVTETHLNRDFPHIYDGTRVSNLEDLHTADKISPSKIRKNTIVAVVFDAKVYEKFEMNRDQGKSMESKKGKESERASKETSKKWIGVRYNLQQIYLLGEEKVEEQVSKPAAVASPTKRQRLF
jgi:hypothetical protein